MTGVVSRAIVGGIMFAAIAEAQTLSPDYAPFYTVFDLGSVPGLPLPYGGLTFCREDPRDLLIGGRAGSTSAQVFRVGLARGDDDGVFGFACGDAVFVADAFGSSGGIDGGLAFGPDRFLFYTTFSDNTIGQIAPGETFPTRVTALGMLGVAPSTGTLAFVPAGFAGAGRLKIVSYTAGIWYDATLTPADDGAFDIGVTTPGVVIGGGPEGVAYIAAGNPGFSADSVLVSEFNTGMVAAYEIDAEGDPLPATRRVFLSGVVGAVGAAVDPFTGDFFFSTFGGGSRLLRVAGFSEVKPPGDTNCDGATNAGDIDSFVLALVDGDAYEAMYPACRRMQADLNADGLVNAGDIDGFVDAVVGVVGCESYAVTFGGCRVLARARVTFRDPWRPPITFRDPRHPQQGTRRVS